MCQLLVQDFFRIFRKSYKRCYKNILIPHLIIISVWYKIFIYNKNVFLLAKFSYVDVIFGLYSFVFNYSMMFISAFISLLLCTDYKGCSVMCLAKLYIYIDI